MGDGGSWGRRAKASSEDDEGDEQAGMDRYFCTSHIPGTVLARQAGEATGFERVSSVPRTTQLVGLCWNPGLRPKPICFLFTSPSCFPGKPGFCIKPHGPERASDGNAYLPGLEVLFLQAPASPVEAVIHQVLLHDTVLGVEEHVAGSTAGGLAHVVHCRRKSGEWP